MSTLKNAISLLSINDQKKGFLVLLLVVGMAILETVGVASVMPFLAVLGDPKVVNEQPLFQELFLFSGSLGVESSNDFLVFLGLIAFSITVFSALYRSFTQYTINLYIDMCRHSISKRILELYLSQQYSFFIDRNSGDLSKIILSEVDQLIANVFRPTYQMIAYAIVFFCIAVLLIIANPFIAIVAAGIMCILYAIIFYTQRAKLSKLGETLVAANKNRFLIASEVFGGIKEVKLLGREYNYIKVFDQSSKDYAKTQALHTTIQQVPNYLVEAVLFGGMLLVTVILISSYGGLDDQLLGNLLPILGLYAFAALRLKPAMQQIYQGVVSLRYGGPVVENISGELKAYEERDIFSELPLGRLSFKKSIVIEDLSFTYPNAHAPTLKNITVQIQKDSSIGVIGTSGAGKTTLIDIILGLLQPTSGQIKIDDVVISNKNIRLWQNLIGYVPQHIYLADSTISQNIAMGVPDNCVDQNQVKKCAQLASIDEFIERELPDGYKTVVGERGVRLSGGQRQRIGIARALYRNPEIIVFDEATSALDSVTQSDVMKSIESLANSKTIIVIAHRLDTLKNCDQLIKIENGTFVEA